MSLTAMRTRAAYTHYQSGHKTETKRCVMLTKGEYVRHKMAGETLIGTIEGAEIQRGRVFYRFQQDPRLREPASALLRETSFSEGELELCDRPSDEYWASINRQSLLAQPDSWQARLGGPYQSRTSRHRS